MGVNQQQIRSVLGGPLSRLTEVEFTPKRLAQVGECIIKTLAEESKKYFAKRGWSGRDPEGGKPIWDSFSYRIRGKSTLEITSTFYGMKELARGDIPEREMPWLTQEAKDRRPGEYKLTDKERQLGMKKTGRVSKGQRLPLVVPIQTKGGGVVLRRAPMTIGEAWVHPGIARFTFFETAVRKWRVRCGRIIAEAVVDAMREASKQG